MLDLCSPMGYNNDVNPLVNWYNNRFMPLGPIYNFNTGVNFNSGNYQFNWLKPFNNMSIWSGLGPIYQFKGTGTISKAETITQAPTIEKNVEEQPPVKISTKELNNTFISNAEKYLGCIEGDETYKKFSSSPEWCADFVSYVVKESYKEKGLPIPKDFGAHNVEDIKQWGIKNNNFLRTTGKENKAQFITQNIKPGNLMILRENNASHIGIVTKVNKDGSFETIEGNVRYNGIDSVVKQNYNANYSDLSGFVRLSV